MDLRIKISLFLLIVSFSVIGQNDCTPYINNNPLFTGKKVEDYPNGIRKSERNYVNDKLHGEFIRYYPNGQTQSIYNYQDDYLHGSFKTFYESGKTESKGNNFYDKNSGQFNSWYEGGALKSQLFYGDGMVSGDAIYYYENGNVDSKRIVKQGSFNVEYSKYYSNGQLEYKIVETNGEFKGTGEFTSFHENGILKCKVNYVNGACVGDAELYDNNGILMEKLFLNEKKLWSRIEYYPNGSLKSVSEIFPCKFMYSTCDRNLFVTTGEKLMFDQEENLMGKQIYYNGNLVCEIDIKEGKSMSVLRFDKKLKEQMEDSLMFNPSATASLTDGVKHIDLIHDLNGKRLIKNGNGNFFDFYYYVSDWELFSATYFNEHENYNASQDVFIMGIFHAEWGDFLKVLPIRNNFSEGDYFQWPNNYANGKIKDGLKQGLWYEGDFFSKNYKGTYYDDGRRTKVKNKIDFEEPYATYAFGDYVDGKKEGVWKLIANNFEVTGKYVKGKKQGQWIAKGRNMNEKYKHYFDRYENNEVLDITGKIIVQGFYRDNQPDSIWAIYNQNTLTIQKQMLFSQGKYVGVLREFYANGKLMSEAKMQGDTLFKIYYSPIGEVISDFDENSYEHIFYTKKDGQKHGPYYAWNNRGVILHKGMYSNDRSHGEQLSFDEKGDTISIINYSNGMMNGMFYYNDKTRLSKGMYKQNEMVGLWIDSSYQYKNVINYMNGKTFLMEYKKEHITYVKNGNGVVVEEDKYRNYYTPYDVAKKETFYKNGLVVKKKEYYQGLKLKSEVVVTIDGKDSMITYNSPYGGICVNHGDGNVTELDYENRIIEIKFYEDGKLQKTEHYDRGKFRYTEVKFPSKYDIVPEIYRTVTKIGDRNYKIECRISKLNGTAEFLKLTEFAPPSYNMKNLDSVSIFFKAGANGINYFSWSTNKDNEVYCSYLIKLPPGQEPYFLYGSALNYVKNGAAMEVKNIIVR